MSISDEVRPPGDEPAHEEGPSRGSGGSGGSRASRQSGGGGNSDGKNGGGGASSRDFERTPPQDVAAEQCVLGGMLMSKDAIADVVEILRTNDFYQPKHAVVFDAILDLYSRGEPADLITVASALVDAAEINRIGGAGYLHTLVSSVPTAANAAYYARIVADRAVLRRLIEAGTRVTQLGYGAAAGGGRDIDDIVDMAQQAIYDVTERRVSEDFAALNELLQPTLDEIEAIGAAGGVMTGVPTGFTDLDRLLNGLHAGQLIIVAGRPGLGKALALDTPLPTPSGWTTMGEVQPGDELIGADGRPTTVVAATDVMRDRPCYEVEFSDGTVIVADAQHQWLTTNRAERRRRPTAGRSYWPADDVARVATAERTSATRPDERVTTEDVLAEVGGGFATVLRSRVLPTVPCLGRDPRTVVRTVPRRTTFTRSAQVYSHHALLAGLAAQVATPATIGRPEPRGSVKTTAELAATLRTETADLRANHAVANCAPFDAPTRDLLIPPYTLGLWLGDGHSAGSRFTSADPELAGYVADDGFTVAPATGLTYGIHLSAGQTVADRACVVCGTGFRSASDAVATCGRACMTALRSAPVSRRPRPVCRDCGVHTAGIGNGSARCASCHRRFGSVTARLRTIGVLNNKHIPADYLRASETQRRALLAGLLDTDGTVTSTGNVQFAVVSRRLAHDVRELVVSLGYRCTIATKRVKGRTEESSTCYTLNFSTLDDVFRLARKRSAHADRRRAQSTARTGSRYIVDVRPIASVPVRCVQVDSEDHLYLAGESWIPTHNSTVAMDFARSCSIKNNMASVIFSLEMSKVEIVMRLLSAEARVPLHTLRSGQLNDDDWTKLARRMGEISEAPLFCDDTPNMNLMEIRAKARRLKQRHDIKLIVVDYLQLMSGPKRVESRQQEVAELSRGLKLLAKEVDCPLIAVSQLNRGPEQRTDKRPQLSDLRESGSIEQDADVVILLNREDYYDKESPRAGEADFIVAKHRNGPTDTITVAAQLHLSRFVDMAVS